MVVECVFKGDLVGLYGIEWVYMGFDDLEWGYNW